MQFRPAFAAGLAGVLAAAAAAPAEAQGNGPVRAEADGATWNACPGFMPEGCRIAVLHRDPAREDADIYFKVPAGATVPGTGTPRPSAWCSSPAR